MDVDVLCKTIRIVFYILKWGASRLFIILEGALRLFIILKGAKLKKKVENHCPRPIVHFSVVALEAVLEAEARLVTTGGTKKKNGCYALFRIYYRHIFFG